MCVCVSVCVCVSTQYNMKSAQPHCVGAIHNKNKFNYKPEKGTPVKAT